MKDEKVIIDRKRLEQLEGENYNDYATHLKRGTFVYKTENGWVVDKQMPILTQDKKYFFNKLPIMKGVEL